VFTPSCVCLLFRAFRFTPNDFLHSIGPPNPLAPPPMSAIFLRDFGSQFFFFQGDVRSFFFPCFSPLSVRDSLGPVYIGGLEPRSPLPPYFLVPSGCMLLFFFPYCQEHRHLSRPSFPCCFLNIDLFVRIGKPLERPLFRSRPSLFFCNKKTKKFLSPRRNLFLLFSSEGGKTIWRPSLPPF